MQNKSNEIEIPSLEEQAKIVALMRAEEVLNFIKSKTQEELIEIPLSVDINNYSKAHFLPEDRGFEPPHHELVKAYFEQLKKFDSKYTNEGVAKLLGLADGRSIRRYSSGEKKVPYDVWRRFLIATGRAPIDMPNILGFFQN